MSTTSSICAANDSVTERATKPHWLSPSGRTKTPDVVVFFDTETTEYEEGDRLCQILRCWDARTRVRHEARPRHWERRDDAGTEPCDLADVVEYAATITNEAWVFAHNIGFDLSVTNLPFVLIERAWNIDALHLGDESTFWVLKRDGQKLVLTDSWSWVRADLATCGKDVSMRKVPLPSGDDSLDVWHRRCKHDVAILDKTMSTILDWWDENDLGRFGITGAGCGWSAMRRHLKPRRILVGPDKERTSFERRAIHSGRKEVYVVGQFAGEWFADYDFVAAYLTTAAAFPLPQQPKGEFRQMPEHLVYDPPLGLDVICEVEITTRTPCAPTRIDDEVWWPTGTFRSVLTGPEIRYAATIADKVTIGAGRTYRMGFALADWAAWCLTVQHSFARDVPPIVARMAKGWGRSVIGRFAAKTSHVVAQRPSTHLGWHLETGHDLDTGAAIDVLSIGGTEFTLSKDQDATDCFPAVLAFVEAHCRVALGQMLDRREPTRLLQCNTDGWWERRAVRSARYELENVPEPYKVTRKALERQLAVLGPNHVQTPSERRFAGIPRKAERTDRGSFQWHDWPGFRWQLEHGEQGTYQRPLKDTTIQDHYVRRWVTSTGETIPATFAVSAEGDTLILPWSETIGRVRTDVLAPTQVERLAPLADTPPTILQAATWPGPFPRGRQRLRTVAARQSIVRS